MSNQEPQSNPTTAQMFMCGVHKWGMGVWGYTKVMGTKGGVHTGMARGHAGGRCGAPCKACKAGVVCGGGRPCCPQKAACPGVGTTGAWGQHPQCPNGGHGVWGRQITRIVRCGGVEGTTPGTGNTMAMGWAPPNPGNAHGPPGHCLSRIAWGGGVGGGGWNTQVVWGGMCKWSNSPHHPI